jgi:hypothetical protein
MGLVDMLEFMVRDPYEARQIAKVDGRTALVAGPVDVVARTLADSAARGA